MIGIIGYGAYIPRARIKLEEIADAFRHEESGRHFGKICLSS